MKTNKVVCSFFRLLIFAELRDHLLVQQPVFSRTSSLNTQGCLAFLNSVTIGNASAWARWAQEVSGCGVGEGGIGQGLMVASKGGGEARCGTETTCFWCGCQTTCFFCAPRSDRLHQFHLKNTAPQYHIRNSIRDLPLKNEMWYCGDLFFVSFVTVHGALKRFTKHFLHSAWLRGLLKQLLGGLIWETTAGNS